jgi:hypothetical protein
MQSTAAGVNNIVINLNGGSYVTVDNFEVVNFRWTGIPAYGTAIGVRLNGTYFALNNLYFHAWTHDNPGVACTPSTLCDVFHIVNGSTALTANAGIVINNLTCDGSPSGTDSGMCTYAVPTVINSTARNMSNGFLLNGMTVTISGNAVGPINQSYDSNDHENCVETTGAQTVYLYNNLIHDCNAGVTVSLGGGSGQGPVNETDYVWNNVIWNSANVPIYIDTTPEPAGSAFMYNNTFVATGVGTCTKIARRNLGNMVVMLEENNLCISDTSNVRDAMLCDSTLDSADCGGATTIALTTNTVMSHSTATSQGFIVGNQYAETATTNATYQADTNLTGICSGPLVALCTSFNAVSRPASGAWDAGAYQMHSSGSLPQPPTRLSALVQ